MVIDSKLIYSFNALCCLASRCERCVVQAAAQLLATAHALVFWHGQILLIKKSFSRTGTLLHLNRDWDKRARCLVGHRVVQSTRYHLGNPVFVTVTFSVA